jgi:hypothetical protein
MHSSSIFFYFVYASAAVMALAIPRVVPGDDIIIRTDKDTIIRSPIDDIVVRNPDALAALEDMLDN